MSHVRDLCQERESEGTRGEGASKRPGYVVERQPVIKSVPVFKSHGKRNIGVAVALVSLLVLGIYFLLLPHPPALGTDPGPAAAGTQAEFNYLSQQNTDARHWPGVNLGDQTANVNWINGLADGTYLQGACCTPMAWTDYQSQIPGLANFSSISLIAPDPYNMPAHTAKADVAGESLVLNADQHSTLSSAASMTTDNGWCCCQCWAYYAHEGLAKALIVHYGYDAQQVAAVTNLQDCCGGPGQMNM